MLGRAVLGALLSFSLLSLSIAAASLPIAARAQEPDAASAAGPDCDATAAGCVDELRPGEVRVIPSRPTELTDGHRGQSTPILVGLTMLAFGGLVVSVLNRLALDES